MNVINKGHICNCTICGNSYNEQEISALRAELAAAKKPKPRPDSHALDAIAVVSDFLGRVTHWREGKSDRDDALAALDAAYDDIDWIEHGIIEWRDVALKAQRDLAAAKADRDSQQRVCIATMVKLASTAALLMEARQELPPTVEANQPEYADLLARIDAAIAGSKT